VLHEVEVEDARTDLWPVQIGVLAWGSRLARTAAPWPPRAAGTGVCAGEGNQPGRIASKSGTRGEDDVLVAYGGQDLINLGTCYQVSAGQRPDRLLPSG
jgi:hypothetical protein